MKPSENPLGSEPVSTLLRRFAVPSVIAMLVSALYNMVDQLFIGHSIGVLGNAATNVAFPLSMVCTSIGLLCGIGGAANFNLCMGRKASRLRLRQPQSCRFLLPQRTAKRQNFLLLRLWKLSCRRFLSCNRPRFQPLSN